MSRPRGVSKFKKSAPSIRALRKRAGPIHFENGVLLTFQPRKFREDDHHRHVLGERHGDETKDVWLMKKDLLLPT